MIKMIGDLKRLHPVFRNAVNHILADMRGAGWDPAIGSGMRTNEQQNALYAQGRKSLQEVNALRRDVELSPISATANKEKVTNAKGGQSNHNLLHSLIPFGSAAVDVMDGYAVDIVDRRRGWENVPKGFWKDLGVIAKKHGCAWGGDWKKPDVAHVEMKLVDGAPRTSIVV